MSLILNIDTATERAGICLAKDGKSILMLQNNDQKDHSSWIQSAIEKGLREAGYTPRDLQAVAVTAGPGSYTGLRVGMATAKGLCYALGIPLITENTLKVMAFAAKEQLSGTTGLLCPMIDARRMDVYAAVYKNDMFVCLPPQAMTVEPGSFDNWLKDDRVSFFGGGSTKCKHLFVSPNADFVKITHHAGHLGILSFELYLHGDFANIVYSEPAYIKEFYSHNRK